MAVQLINIGTTANDRTGDNLRTAFNKINANFTELYTQLGLDELPLNLGAFEFTGSVMSTTDSSGIIIDQAVTVTSDLTVSGNITAQNLRTVTSSDGLKQVYFDPATGHSPDACSCVWPTYAFAPEKCACRIFLIIMSSGFSLSATIDKFFNLLLRITGTSDNGRKFLELA